MKLRHGGQQQPALDMDTDTGTYKGKVPSSATDTTVGAKPADDHFDQQYKIERKPDEEEGSLTNSLAKLYRNKLSSLLSIISDTLFEVSKVFSK